jgi:hypothetical protein
MSARGVGRIDRFVLGLLLTLSSATALSQSGVTKSKATLLLASDVACTVKLDGDKVADLQPDVPKKIGVAPGEHLVSASTPDGQEWSRVLTATGAGQTFVKIEFGGGAGGGGEAGASTILFMSDAPALIEIDGKKSGEVGGSPEAPGQ